MSLIKYLSGINKKIPYLIARSLIMAGIRFTNAKGVVTSKNSSGVSFERDSQSTGFYPFKVDSTQTFTANATLSNGDCGVNIISASTAAVLTMSLPAASGCAGAMFLFRCGNAAGHVITGSAASSIALTGSLGSKLTLGNTTNAAVALQSDGNLFHVLSFSTTCALGTG